MTHQTQVAREGTTDAANVSAIDVDVHHQVSDWSDIAEFAPSGLRHRFLRKGGPPLAEHGYAKVGPKFGTAPIPENADGTRSHPASDPAWVKEQYLDRYGIDRAILTGNLLHLGVQPGTDIASAVACGVNDWTLERWVRPFECFKGSILVSQQDPVQAAEEIDRLGNDPGMVQVLMSSASEAPLGRRGYHPIYEACVRNKLPLALHFGGEGAGSSHPPTAVGHPSTFFEWHGSLPQTYMAHVVSMVTEGVFTKFPELKVILYEAGIFWLPPLMWRFDKNWKAQRAETPWVQELPSEYILRHFRLATYPLEAPPSVTPLIQILEMINADSTLLFSSNFPNWEYGDPCDMLNDIPETLRQRVMMGNAMDLYGDRLLASNR